MYVTLFGDRRGTLPAGWINETIIALLGDARIDATGTTGTGARMTFLGLAATRSSLSRPAEVRTGWYAWALPSAQLAALALVGILYGLVPEGRWRQTGKWVATALVILIAFAHLYLGWRYPPTCWSGWRSGWPFRCSASACSAPSQVFPITYTYRRRRSAHGGRPSMAAAQAEAEPTP